MKKGYDNSILSGRAVGFLTALRTLGKVRFVWQALGECLGLANVPFSGTGWFPKGLLAFLNLVHECEAPFQHNSFYQQVWTKLVLVLTIIPNESEKKKSVLSRVRKEASWRTGTLSCGEHTRNTCH